MVNVKDFLCGCNNLPLPSYVCILGNVAGYVAGILWLAVLLPTCWRSCRFLKRQAPESSRRWALFWKVVDFIGVTWDFFLVLRHELPLFVIVPVFCMFVTHFTQVVQLAHSLTMPAHIIALMAFLGLSSFTISIEVTIPDTADFFGWCAYILWALESFPQIHSNMLRRSSEQHIPSLALITTMRSLTALMNYTLATPMQGVVRDFFACSCSYINVLQAMYYYNNRGSPTTIKTPDPEGIALLPSKPNSCAPQHKLALWILVPWCLFILLLLPPLTVLRAESLMFLLLPAALVAILLVFYVHTHACNSPITSPREIENPQQQSDLSPDSSNTFVGWIEASHW
ncbi:hypothetical protein Pelo_18480 [Pelomyxa schiedti]|nr:hypothetical protein Pelo_18480 [Pelomyxa schiedti]